MATGSEVKIGTYIAAQYLVITVFALVTISANDVRLAGTMSGKLIARSYRSVVELDRPRWITLTQFATVLLPLGKSIAPIS